MLHVNLIFRRTMAMFLLLASCVCAPAFGQQQKKLIFFGYDSPYPHWMRDHIAEMEQFPLDGTVFHMSSSDVGYFSTGVFGPRQFSKSELQWQIDALQQTNFNKFTDNFLYVTSTSSGNYADKSFVDWFDSAFDAVISNMRLAATAAKEGGAKGIFFDPEAYAGPLWNYTQQRDKNTRTYEQYRDQVRLRGQQVMQALQEEYPGITVMTAMGYTYPHVEMGDNRPDRLRTYSTGLYAAFLDGMIDAAAPTTKLIDGDEPAYLRKSETEAHYDRERSIFTNNVLPYVGVTDQKYHDTMDLGLGVWIDTEHYGPYDWSDTNFSNNFYQPAELENALKYAIAESDEYVWLYSETVMLWGQYGLQEGQTWLPPEYRQAIANAHATVPEPGSLTLLGGILFGCFSLRRRK